MLRKIMILYLYKCMLRFYSIELCLQYNIFNSVVTRGCKVGDCPPCLGGQHHVMFDQIILLLATQPRYLSNQD